MLRNTRRLRLSRDGLNSKLPDLWCRARPLKQANSDHITHSAMQAAPSPGGACERGNVRGLPPLLLLE